MWAILSRSETIRRYVSRFSPYIGLAICFLGTAAGAEVRFLDSPATEGSRSYSLAAAADGTVYLSWVERVEHGGHALRFSALHGDEWAHAMTVAEGNDWFVNWIDHPAVVPLGGDRLAAHWLVHDEDRQGDYGYGIRLVFSEDRGASWREVFEASGEGNGGYAGFVAYAGVAGGFEVAYLSTVGDDVATKEATDSPVPTGDGHGEVEPRMTLRSARLDLGGTLKSDREVDADVCSCCTTAMAATAGNVFLAFRDRREGEFRDISFTRFRGRSMDGFRTGSPGRLAYPGMPHERSGARFRRGGARSRMGSPPRAESPRCWQRSGIRRSNVSATRSVSMTARLAGGPVSRFSGMAARRSVGSNGWKAALNCGSVGYPGMGAQATRLSWRQRLPAAVRSASPSLSAPATASSSPGATEVFAPV